MKHCLITTFCLLIFSYQGCMSYRGLKPAKKVVKEPLSIGFWKVENLFDLEDDPNKNDDEYFQYRQQLATNFIMSPGNIPNIKIAFGTSNAVGATDDMGDACETVGAGKGLYAAEPDVTVTIE